MAKAPDKWATYCPDCKARIQLPVTVKAGPKILGQQAIEARVTVDAGPMRQHMIDAHGKGLPAQATQ
jgi:hypothetical protein